MKCETHKVLRVSTQHFGHIFFAFYTPCPPLVCVWALHVASVMFTTAAVVVNVKWHYEHNYCVGVLAVVTSSDSVKMVVYVVILVRVV